MLMAGAHGTAVSAVLLLTALQGIFCLQCKVGVNNETSAMECEGSWDKMQEMMKEKMGGKWEDMKSNLTGDMTSLMEQLKKQFDDLKNKLQNALTPATETERRRKREVQSFQRVKRSEETDAEPEPEGDAYYCIKKTMAGNTVKSCLPKSVADPLKMACGILPTAGTVCVCNDKDLCNGGQKIGWSTGVLLLALVASVWSRI